MPNIGTKSSHILATTLFESPRIEDTNSSEMWKHFPQTTVSYTKQRETAVKKDSSFPNVQTCRCNTSRQHSLFMWTLSKGVF